jgi:DNA-binding beta-propeller fold protein YncE
VHHTLVLAVVPALTLAVAWLAGSWADAPAADDRPAGRGRIVVANRASGTITVVDPRSDLPAGTYPLPAGRHAPEPMYVVDAGHRRVLVGDRSNDRLVVFDALGFRVKGTIAAGRGVFHMCAGGGRLWVNNDLDNTSTVIDLRTLATIATVRMPADLVALGGRPHDVALDSNHGRYAYVTMTAVAGAADYVVKFSTATFEEVARTAVGKDPHVTLDERHEQLLVPCQGSSELHVLDAASLSRLAVLAVPGAHAAAASAAGRRVYATNLPGSAADAVFTLDTRSLTLLGRPASTSFPAPHNLALSPDGRKIYVTHAGATSSVVSVFRVDESGLPQAPAETVPVGLNPFGIAYVR